ncbi:MAG: portal protein [Paludibacteraceae bacterium]|nr:portal protein [Paludibacteraceae bacterium]
MNILSFINPFSDGFLQNDSDQAYLRELEGKLNSYGVNEDSFDYATMMNQYSPYAASHNQANILFDVVFKNKMEKISTYRYMSLFPLVRKSLHVIVNEIIRENSHGEVVKFDIKDAFKSSFTKAEYEQLKEEFNYVINCVIKKDELWYYVYKWFVDAEVFWELCPNNEKTSLVAINSLPAYCTSAIYDHDVLTGFIQDPSMVNSNIVDPEIKTFTRDQVAYCSYGFWGSNRNDIIGHLDPVVRPVNQLRAIQDALTIYRITRAPERRQFKIFTGTTPNSKIQGLLDSVKKQYFKTMSIDHRSGAISGNRSVNALTEDFIFGINAAGNGSTVEYLKGSTEFSTGLDDLKYFQHEVVDGMLVPVARTIEGETPSTYTSAPETAVTEIDFQTNCKRWGKKFCNDMILHTFMQQLRLRNYEKKYLDSTIYEINFIAGSDFQRIREMSFAEKIGGVMGSFSTFLPTLANSSPTSEEINPVFSKQFVMEKFFGLTTDEIITNDEMVEKEKQKILDAAKKAKEEAAANGEDDEEEDDVDF